MHLDALVTFGGEVKALAEEPDRLKVGGYVVLFGTPETPDLSPHRDYFTKATDFGFDVATRGRIRWHHGLDPKVGRAVLGLAEMKTEPDDVGVWAEGWIGQRTAYEKQVGDWVKARKAGWSTGVPAHCVGRKAVGDAHEITEWPLGADISITLTPADPRQAAGVMALKSLVDEPEAAPAPEPEAPAAAADEDADPLALIHDTFKSLRLTDHFEATRAVVAKLADRLAAYASVKTADGHPIPAARVAEIKRFRDDLDALVVAAGRATGPGADRDAQLIANLEAEMALATLALHGD